MKKNIILASLLFLATNTFAATNPVGWSITPASGFPAQTLVGSTYAITYTLTNNLPFATPLTVSADYTGGAFYVANGCNRTLAAKGQANSSCLVHVAFQPLAAKQNSFRLTMAYGKDRVPLPVVMSTSTSSETVEKINGSVTTPLPSVTYLGTTYPVAFSFINNGNATVTATAVDVVGFTPTANTCYAALTPNSTCAVSGTFIPTVTGQANLGVTYTYNNGGSKSVALTTQTNVQTSSGACHHVDGYAALPLPISSYTYADNVVQFVFTNHCDASTETLGNVNFTVDGAATLTKGTDTCSGATLAANGSCSVYVSVVPTTATTDLSVTAFVGYNNGQDSAGATTSEAANALTNQQTLHTVMFVNQCNQNVWYEFQNGIGGSGTGRKSPDPTPPNQRSFADYQLNAQLRGAAPSTKVLLVDEYINGAIYGRTQCNASTGVCATANCPVISGTATCQAGVGANNPTTIFELNMTSSTGSDGVYDVSVINGFNIPGEVKSLSPLSSNPFGCGQAAGAVIQPTGSSLGACPWSFTPPSTTAPDTPENYYWVSGGAQDGCVSSTSCGANEYCGMAYNTTTEGTTPINRRCGSFLGYWTIADYVGYSSNAQWGAINLYTDYGLGNVLPTGPNGPYGNVQGSPATYAAIYSCQITDNNSLNSGYTYTQNVCGCYNWNQAGSVAPTAQASQCTASNSDWINTVFGRISWLKQACPTAYSYQFDDKSVSFQCNNSGLKTSYQITFCPAGKTGEPGT